MKKVKLLSKLFILTAVIAVTIYLDHTFLFPAINLYKCREHIFNKPDIVSLVTDSQQRSQAAYCAYAMQDNIYVNLIKVIPNQAPQPGKVINVVTQ